MRTFIFIVFILCAAQVFSQTNGYAGYLRLGGFSMPDARNVSGQIVPGVEGFKRSFYGIGGELEYKFNRKIIDAELMISSHGPTNFDTQYAEPFAGAVMLKTGYAIIDNKNFFMYPNVGFGISSILINTYTKSGSIKSELHTVYMFQPAMDIGLNANIIVYQFKPSLPSGMLPVGLRAGYRFAASSDNWKRINETGLQKKNFSTRGWYVSIALGMGYSSSVKNK